MIFLNTNCLKSNFCFIAKKSPPPSFIEMAGSASDPIDNASCTIHLPESLRGLRLIRREILLWYRLHLHSNPPRSLFWLYYSCTSGVFHRIWLFLPRLQSQLAGSVIMCMYLCLMIDVKHPYKTVLNTQWFDLCICGFIYFMSGTKHQNETVLYIQWFALYMCSLKHLRIHILIWVALYIHMKLSIIYSDNTIDRCSLRHWWHYIYFKCGVSNI